MREIVDHLRTCFRVSIRRVFRAVPAPRSTFHYRPRRPEQALLRERIREIAQTRVRNGYRRSHVLLRREGWMVNAKRVRRLYCLEGLQMRHKPPRRRVMTKLREDRAPATAPNQVWAMDWIYDQLFDGRRIWVLTMVDTHSRICPALRVCRVANAAEVVSTLDEAVRRHGTPARIRVDQGCQFTSPELDLWAYSNGVVLDFSRPGKPTDNAHAEAFNARFRAECLNEHWFLDLDDARVKVESWRVDYNEVRPHSALGDRTPMSLISAPELPLEGDRKPEILT